MYDLGVYFLNVMGYLDGRDEYMFVEECGNMLIMGLVLVNVLRYDIDFVFVRLKGVEGMRMVLGVKRWWESVDEYGIDLFRGEVKFGFMFKVVEKWLLWFYKFWK